MENPEDLLIVAAAKYEKLRQQRLNATKKWNSAHRDKVNEYNKFYQRRLNAKKKKILHAPLKTIMTLNNIKNTKPNIGTRQN